MRYLRRPFKEELKDVLAPHVAERRGALALVSILLVLTAVVIWKQWFYEPAPLDPRPYEQVLEQWAKGFDRVSADSSSERVLFRFDPNTIERREWLALGLTDRQVDGIERYQAKGGRFRIKQDLARMYTISAEQFQRLEPFIDLPATRPARVWAPRPSAKASAPQREWSGHSKERHYREPRVLEVNTADSISLVALPGIGPSFAKGIMKFRDQLGGYISLDQLAEVYVLKDKPDALERIRALLVVDTLQVDRIPINTCTVEELAAHPYVRWKLARILIAYRHQHGPFREVADILGCKALDEPTFRKLAPYLSVE